MQVLLVGFLVLLGIVARQELPAKPALPCLDSKVIKSRKRGARFQEKPKTHFLQYALDRIYVFMSLANWAGVLGEAGDKNKGPHSPALREVSFALSINMRNATYSLGKTDKRQKSSRSNTADHTGRATKKSVPVS